MSDVLSRLGKLNLYHVVDKIVEDFSFREVLNLAHVCRDWRSLVFKYDLLEEFMERFDENEDYISKDTLEKELKSCCVRLMVTADPVLNAAYQFKRIDLIKKKQGLYSVDRQVLYEITQIESELGNLPSRYLYTQFSVWENYMAVLEPYGWISIVNLDDMTLVNKFQAYTRAEFNIWLGIVMTEDYIFCSIWSDQWQTRIYDWEGELKQRLPSGELHVNGDMIAISSNSNDQVVVYSLSEILELPLFNVEFGNMEHDFMWELMPMELGGLFTWKPNVAMNENYFVVEWNVAKSNLTSREREISLYNNKGYFIQHFKCEEDPKTPVQICFFEQYGDTYCIIANEFVEVYRIVKFFCEKDYERAYFINKFHLMEPGGCRLTCCVGSDSIVFGYNISKEDTPEGRTLNLVVLSFKDIINHARYDADDDPPVPPCKPSIVLSDIISPTIINTDTKLILLHRNGHVTSLDFVNIRREQRNQMFDDTFKIEKNDKIFKIPELKPPKKSRGELAKMMEDRFAEVSRKEEVREAEAEAAREAVRQNERRDSIRHRTTPRSVPSEVYLSSLYSRYNKESQYEERVREKAIEEGERVLNSYSPRKYSNTGTTSGQSSVRSSYTGSYGSPFSSASNGSSSYRTGSTSLQDDIRRTSLSSSSYGTSGTSGYGSGTYSSRYGSSTSSNYQPSSSYSSRTPGSTTYDSSTTTSYSPRYSSTTSSYTSPYSSTYSSSSSIGYSSSSSSRYSTTSGSSTSGSSYTRSSSTSYTSPYSSTGSSYSTGASGGYLGSRSGSAFRYNSSRY